MAKKRVDNRRYNKHRTNLVNGAKDVSHRSRRDARWEREMVYRISDNMRKNYH